MSFFQKIQQWHENSLDVLSMNNRNLGYIYSLNNRKHFPMADDKVLAKKILSEVGVPVPGNYLLVDSFYKVSRIDEDLNKLSDFVLKPAQGRGGGGIIVITEKVDNGWKTASGKTISISEIKRHVADIIFGSHSFDKSDVAIFEERLIPAELLYKMSPWGLPDIRVIAVKNKLMMAMCRVPTRDSGGRANIHQGAVAIGIDIKTGITTHALHNNKLITEHPDHGLNLIGLQLPFWDQVVATSKLCAKTLPLKYLGVDVAICVDGPKVLEVNARPGLAIQLANDKGMMPLLMAAGDDEK